MAVFDVDVVGGVNIKRIFAEEALSVFIMPPSVEELRVRLIARATDTTEAIERRVAKASAELEYAPQFDRVVINDNLEEAVSQVRQLVMEFIEIV